MWEGGGEWITSVLKPLLVGFYCSRCALFCRAPHCPQSSLSLPSTESCLAPFGPMAGPFHSVPMEAQGAAGGTLSPL